MGSCCAGAPRRQRPAKGKLRYRRGEKDSTPAAPRSPERPYRTPGPPPGSDPNSESRGACAPCPGAAQCYIAPPGRTESSLVALNLVGVAEDPGLPAHAHPEERQVDGSPTRYVTVEDRAVTPQATRFEVDAAGVHPTEGHAIRGRGGLPVHNSRNRLGETRRAELHPLARRQVRGKKLLELLPRRKSFSQRRARSAGPDYHGSHTLANTAAMPERVAKLAKEFRTSARLSIRCFLFLF